MAVRIIMLLKDYNQSPILSLIFLSQGVSGGYSKGIKEDLNERFSGKVLLLKNTSSKMY
jgi:hypothetical protein